MPLDDPNGVSAMTLTTLLNSGVEEALSTLSPSQLIQLEKNVQKLKKQKGPTPKKRAKSSYDDGDYSTPRRHSGGQYLNLPASAPEVEIRDGIEHLRFTYSTKGVVQEYIIRTDIENIHQNDIPDDFKQENCVYPRALCPREAYQGNRWEYETVCNDLAWRLTWMNPNLLSGKRGLIQRAVDSFRNRFQESRSRRVIRQEKLSLGTLRRRNVDNDSDSESRGSTKMMNVVWSNKGVSQRLRLRIDIENADINEMDEGFREMNCIYPHAMIDRDSYTGTRFEYETTCNELAWKLAWLNASKLHGKKMVLAKAVDTYRAKFPDKKKTRYDGYGDYEQKQDFSEIVANTLQQALSSHDQNQMSLESQLGQSDPSLDDLHPRTVSTAELLSNLG